MKYRKLDNNGDYCFGNNAKDFVEGADAVSQAIMTNLKLLYAEWWENIDKGLPLFQNILGAPGTTENIRGADLLIQGSISSTLGVKSIKLFTSVYENRTYSLACTVETIYGDVEVKEVFQSVL